MPHLSLVRIGGTGYVVADGELIPVRGDILLDDLQPTMPYRFRVAF
jgi:hypothetical protein